MRRFSILAAFVVMAACGTFARAADAPAATYTDPKNGFSMQAPDLGTSKVTITPVIFSGPVELGFSANVTVRITPEVAVMKDFLPKNLADLKGMNAKVLSQKTMTVSGREAALLEFSATINGKALHFLSLSVLAPDKVYIVTGTALDANYATYEAGFERCVESFSLPK